MVAAVLFCKIMMEKNQFEPVVVFVERIEIQLLFQLVQPEHHGVSVYEQSFGSHRNIYIAGNQGAYGLMGRGGDFHIVLFIFEKVFKRVFRNFVYKVFCQKVIYIIDSLFHVRPVLRVPENSLGRNGAVAVMPDIRYGEPHTDTAGDEVIFIQIPEPPLPPAPAGAGLYQRAAARVPLQGALWETGGMIPFLSWTTGNTGGSGD